ncbi:hypothetical protein F0562_023674 [Nyssa sinensis]|uniref:Cation/H+ exchanger domain-containing protein n=1 Tax=Nyssa sinensis TaxID=561372 RepID=A0A5J5BLF1_9ASTE|nr:hypothetical protein F0562_023674 [Nyssa sinensis]
MNNTQIRSVCVKFPPKIHSVGFWDKRNPLSYSLPTLELQMVIIFALTRLFHFPLKKLGFPKLFSQIVAGVILGPTLLGRIKNYQFIVFPFETQGIIGTFSAFGYVLFVFLVGVKLDMSIIKRTGAKGVGDWSFISNGPFDNWYNKHMANVTACLLKDLKILNSELGRLSLASAVVSDLLFVFISTMGTTAYVGLYSRATALVDLVLLVGFVIFVIFVFRPAMIWVVEQTPEGRPVKGIYIYLIIMGVFMGALFSHYFEQSLNFGFLILGLAIPAGPPLGSALVDKLDSFVSGLLLPLFISTTAMRTNLSTLHITKPLSLANIILIIVTSSAKFLSCFLPALYCSMPFNDSVALSLIMSAKGSVDLAAYSFLRDEQIITRETFALVVISVALTAVFVQVLVKYLYDPSRKYAGYQRRNIMHSEDEGKLQVLTCIHRVDNVTAVIKLLDASNPTRETPITVYVLHLIELQGQATPLFISHQVQKRTVTSRSYSEDIILAFSKYERLNWGAVTIQAFTAISPQRLMHEDICTLALDTLASIVILPFHQKWAIDGSIESEDHCLRTLNFSVLNRAPCSVGILVDRGQSGSSSSSEPAQASYHVAMIFVGGNDDQEALTYAKRMAKCSNVSLTVIRLISLDDEDLKNIGKSLDLQVLDDVKLNNGGNRRVKYIEQVVKDGRETAQKVCPMINDYDLVIVGRRNNLRSPQTAGLEQWSEFPELGVIGELLALSELKSRASVLVVQQQHINH